MPILNYTTEISAKQTIDEIQTRLVNFGATNISIQYQNKLPVELLFTVPIRGKQVGFRLPTKYEGVYKILQETNRRKYKTEEHALDVAWRIAGDWVEAQLAIVEAGLAEISEVFLPYAVTPNGQTLYEIASSGGIELLTAGKVEQ